MHQEPELPVRVGDIVAGKYQVERVLGAGGMGVVLAARHVQLNDRVALKFLLPKALANHEVVERFLREARSAVKIKSEHVARVLDVGTLETGAPYMVMEFLEGRDMSDEIARRGRLPAAEAVDYVLQACEAIAEAHSLGIVHRDLKPANLFRVERSNGTSTIKVLDFGIAKSAIEGEIGAEQKALTATSSVMGSPLYMSPEQMRSTKNTDARSDIWSLGVILYQMLTGRVPFDADTLSGVVAAVFTDPVAPLSSHGLEAPPGLEQVLARCLEKSPQARFASVAELAVALEPFASPMARLSVSRITGLQGPASSLPPPASALGARPADALSETAPAPLSVSTYGQSSPRKARLLLGLGSAAALAALLVGGLAMKSQGSERGAGLAGGPLPAEAPVVPQGNGHSSQPSQPPAQAQGAEPKADPAAQPPASSASPGASSSAAPAASSASRAAPRASGQASSPVSSPAGSPGPTGKPPSGGPAGQAAPADKPVDKPVDKTVDTRR